MGTGCTQGKKIVNQHNVQEQPKQAETFNQQNSPSLQFELELSNIKVKNLPGVFGSEIKSICVQLMIQPFLDKVLEQTPVADIIKWKVTERSSMKFTMYELCKKYLIVNVFTDSRVKIASLKLNLYQISVGPYHQDFLLKAEEKRQARIRMDVKISQIVEINIQPKELKVEMNTDHPGQAFHFTLKTMEENGVQFQTEASYNAETKLYSKIPGSGTSVSHPCTKIFQKRQSFRTKRSVVLELGQKLMWTSAQSRHLQNQELPSLQIFANVSRITSYGFQILLWKVKSESQDGANSPIVEEVELYSQSRINLNNILMGIARAENPDKEDKNVVDIDLTQKIWNEGKHLGLIRLKCEVKIPEYSKQLLGCVRTENGISSVTPPFCSSTTSKGSSCLEVKKLIQFNDLQQKHFEQYDKELNSYRPNQLRKMTIKRGITEGFSGISSILEISINKYKKIYNYKSEGDLLKGQLTLLEIGFELLKCLQNVNTSLSDTFWKTFTLLINREEFNLSYIGFNPNEKLAIQESSEANMNKTLAQKINLRLKYQQFMYLTLKACMTRKYSLENQQVFAILFSAQSFFRIPQHRQCVTQLISKPTDKHNLDDMGLTGSSTPIDQSLKMYLNWSENFYEPLKNLTGYNQNHLLLKQILQNPEYHNKLKERSTSFFCFVVQCVTYIDRLTIGQTKSINWMGIPGYIDLAKAFLCEMYTRPIQKYPDVLEQASCRLLDNENILNLFVRIIFNKTNLFVKSQVFQTLELLNKYFVYLSKQEASIPILFDYKFFYSGVKTILESEHSFIISKCLELLYNHYPSFNMAFRRDLGMFLMGKIFFRFFLHWSHLVRQVFHNILIYRINLDCNYSSQQKLPRLDEVQIRELCQRYEKVLIILKNAQKKKSQSTIFTPNLNVNYHKRMRARLIDIRLNKGLKSVVRKQSDEAYSIIDLESLSVGRSMSETSPVFHQSTDFPHKTSTCLEVNQQMRRRKGSSNFTQQMIDDQFRKDKKKQRIVTSLYEIDQQLNQTDLRESLEYLEIALTDFSNTEDLFRKTMMPSFSHKDAPDVKINIPMDEGDIRPDDIDEY